MIKPIEIRCSISCVRSLVVRGFDLYMWFFTVSYE